MTILEDFFQKITTSNGQTGNQLSNLARKLQVLKEGDMLHLAGGKSIQNNKGLTDLNKPTRVFQYQ